MANLLIVDDERSITELLSIMLTRYGHRVLVANSLDEAHGAISIFKFDVIVTDFHLSNLERGTELYSYGIPLILMSGGISEEELARYSGKFDLFVPKPFTPIEIKYAIEVFLDIS